MKLTRDSGSSVRWHQLTQSAKSSVPRRLELHRRRTSVVRIEDLYLIYRVYTPASLRKGTCSARTACTLQSRIASHLVESDKFLVGVTFEIF